MKWITRMSLGLCLRRLVLAGWVLGISQSAWAIQSGRVLTDGAEVHQYPNRTSPQLSTVHLNTLLRMSSNLVEDIHGEFWYKIVLPEAVIGSEYGYIRAPDVAALGLKKDLKVAGIDTELATEPTEPYPWFLLFRLMGLAGTGVATSTDSFGNFTAIPSVDYGGEAEFSICPLIFTHGYWHRFFAVGVAYQYFSTDSMLAGSLIFRFFTSHLWEPEIRVRVAEGLTSGLPFVGVNFGAQFPFSLDPKSYFAGYLELGDLVGFPLGGAPIHVYGSGGIGFHF